MLVINRRAGEAVVLSGGVRVTVAEIKGNRVKLMFTAPPEVEIWRQEIAPAAVLNAALPQPAPRPQQ